MFLNKVPEPVSHLNYISEMLLAKKPFTFIRFSDGETEIIKNRYLEISDGRTIFRGKKTNNTYPVFDSKRFDPTIHQNIRHDLISSAMYKSEYFYKGIPSLHNNALDDKDLLLRLNGGFDKCITFSDLFLNSNYLQYRKNVSVLFCKFSSIYVIANYRAVLKGGLKNAKLIGVGDNFFSNYEETLSTVISSLDGIPPGSLVLSSASSLSKIVGWKLHEKRQDLTFVDIGTSINDDLSLDNNTRAYHTVPNSIFKKIKEKRKNRGYDIKW